MWIKICLFIYKILNKHLSVQFSSVQFLGHVRLFVIPWIAALQASLSITNSRSSLKLTSIESVMPSSHLILCCPLLLLRPIPPSIRVFSNESTLRMRWPKYWSFSFSIIPSREYPGLISFRMDWLDLFAVQGTLKSLLQHHSSKGNLKSKPLVNQFFKFKYRIVNILLNIWSVIMKFKKFPEIVPIVRVPYFWFFCFPSSYCIPLPQFHLFS